MDNTRVLSQEELFSQEASAAAIAEATAFKTVPTGSYQIKLAKFVGKQDAPTDQFPKGRIRAQLTCNVLDAEGKKQGSITFSISREIGRVASTGKLDRLSKMDGQLMKALFPDVKNDADLAKISWAEVFSRFEQYPVQAFITETFSTDIDPLTGARSYFDAKTPEEAKAYRERGLKANNNIQSIGRVKG